MSGLSLTGSGIEKRFGRVTALAGIDFSLAPGESVAILGANGAGKSTWLRLLAGLARPSAGLLVAVPVASAGPPPTTAAMPPLSREALRGRVGYVGHATLLAGELTARENLLFAARLHGRHPTRAEQDALFFDLGLEEVADRRVSAMSRGTAQRVSIARGLVHAPDLLLLDEPFTGLDEISAERLSGQLARLRDGGRSIVVVTHDPQRAVELADRAWLLHRGRIRATPRRGDGNDFEVGALRDALLALAREDAARTQARIHAGVARNRASTTRSGSGPDDPAGRRSP